MHVANLWLFFYEAGATPPAPTAVTTTTVQIDLPAEPEHEYALAGGLLLGD